MMACGFGNKFMQGGVNLACAEIKYDNLVFY